MFDKHNNISNRMISVDIETTGMNKSGLIYLGHKIIEIGAIEIINRKITKNKFHVFLNPEREIDNAAFKIHGISNKFLNNKPKFHEIYLDFMKYIQNSDIIVHNANFDIKFLEYEIKNVNHHKKKISDINKIIDTLILARSFFPGKKNNLNALCERYNINISHRELHSALIDAELLAELYLRMTRVQKKIIFQSKNLKNKNYINNSNKDKKLVVLKATKEEKNIHLKYLNKMKKLYSCLWIEKYKI